MKNKLHGIIIDAIILCFAFNFIDKIELFLVVEVKMDGSDQKKKISDRCGYYMSFCFVHFI
jgi:hypothetical protein